MRLIDADALLEAIDNQDNWLSQMDLAQFNIYSLINTMPTVERKPFASVTFDKDELERIVDERVIEPIKNGELVVKEERPQGEWIITAIQCPNCLAYFHRTDGYSMKKLKECPNCGAKMTKEAENEGLL